MPGRVAAIFRHPVKGFTPEPLDAVDLAPGQGFPFDRVWAVENGPSGFDPAAPAWVSKQKFAVLATLPRVAAAVTRYDAAEGLLHARAAGLEPFRGRLDQPDGRAAFAAWLSALLGEDAAGPLRIVEAPADYRFTDHPQGQLSIVNLASVRDLGRRMGVELDPRRFRANLYVDGWPAWAELDWTGRLLRLGAAQARVFKSIVRCAATDVNPQTAARDLEITRALFDSFGHMNCGVYVHVTAAGLLRIGDRCPAPDAQIAEPQGAWA